MAKPKPPSSKVDFATVILSMTYGELLEVSQALANVKRNGLVTREDFASLLHAWAEAQ